MQNFEIKREVQVKETVTITLSIEAAQELRALYGMSSNSKYLHKEFSGLDFTLWRRNDTIRFTGQSFDFKNTEKVHE